MGTIRISVPGKGACAVCATYHDPAQPHDRNSLYYRNHFWQEHKRFPTIEDASAHCSPEVRDRLTGKSADTPGDKVSS